MHKTGISTSYFTDVVVVVVVVRMVDADQHPSYPCLTSLHTASITRVAINGMQARRLWCCHIDALSIFTRCILLFGA